MVGIDVDVDIWWWFSLNILLPFVPLALLFFIKAVHWSDAGYRWFLLKSTGKGELYWGAMGMYAQTCYELYLYGRAASHDDAVWAAVWGTVLAGAILVCVTQIGEAARIEPTVPAGTWRHHVPNRFIFFSSIVATIAASVGFAASHYIAVKEQKKTASIDAAKLAKAIENKTIIKLKQCLSLRKFDCMEARENE